MEQQRMLDFSWPELYQKLFAAAMGITGDRHTAEELTQETCLKIHQKHDGFRGESQFFTWAYAMLLNQYRDYCRQAKRRLHLSLARVKTLSNSVDFSEYIAACSLLDKLPQLQKQMFILREFYGCSYQEIASLTRCSLESVRTRLYRTRKQLAQWTIIDT